MKEYSVAMALVDFIPVALYLIANITIAKDLKVRMSKIYYSLYTGGVILVTSAGAFKALYKLLYAVGVGDFVWMSDQFFSNQSFGFLIAGLGLAAYVIDNKQKKVNGFIPVMGLVGIMVAGLGMIDASFCILAARAKKKGTIVFFVFSFIFCMMMGYLSSRDFTKSYMNWAAEIINLAGQTMLFLGCRSLHKAYANE